MSVQTKAERILQAEALKQAAGADEALVVGPDQPDNAKFGAYLKNLRDEAGLSRADAAEQLGLSAEYLRLVEKGQRTPALGQLRNFIEAYGADGTVEKRLPDGKVIDFQFALPDPGPVVIVEFKSRIREARRRSVVVDAAVAAVSVAAGLRATRSTPTHDALVGKVVSKLATADADTLTKVLKLLERG